MQDGSLLRPLLFLLDRQYKDDFVRWSTLRSGYLSQASADEARVNVGVGDRVRRDDFHVRPYHPAQGAATLLPRRRFLSVALCVAALANALIPASFFSETH